MIVANADAVGIGTSSPATWAGDLLQTGSKSLYGQLDVNGAAYVANNVAYDGSNWKYITTDTGALYAQDPSGENDHVWYTVASGTAGATATLDERMRIEENGHVGIGTATPAQKFTVHGSDNQNLIMSSNSGGNSNTMRIQANNAASYIVSSAAVPLIFDVQNTERMRIGASGGVSIGTTTIGTAEGLTIDGSSASDRLLKIQDSDSSVDASNIMVALDFSNDDNCDNAKYIGFEDSNGLIGSVSVNGAAAVSYNTSSDYRLKENVSYDWDATTRLKQLRPARFNWISDPTDTLIDGFLAHEVSDIVPEAITGEKDATETVTNAVLNANGKVIAKGISEDDWTEGKTGEDSIYPSDSTWEASHEANLYQGIDQAKLVPLLVKTIQELEARITTLENA